ncbi:MAG TPA: (2Fe-2S)-binding protein [Nitrososphaerales archaeon]|nr:(2Fe-2S)-binding protein [Nitrososphaerales archaeon]
MKVPINVEVNGVKRDAEVEPRKLLVQFLRENLGLTGTHVGCDTTNCGACAVLLDGKAVKSCSVFAVQADGRRVTTIERIGTAEELHPIQLAFWEKHGLQCGFCTPGMIISTHFLLQQNPDPSEEEIRKALSGNLCRCTGYTKIIESVKYAAKLSKKGAAPIRRQQRRVSKTPYKKPSESTHAL